MSKVYHDKNSREINAILGFYLYQTGQEGPLKLLKLSTSRCSQNYEHFFYQNEG